MLIFLLTSLILRLLGFTASALWYDEAVSKYRASLPFFQYLVDTADYNGANLWEILLRPVAMGPVWLLRLPALAAGMLSLWLAWKLMEAWGYDQSEQRTAAVGLALLPGMLWMAQDARYYAAMSACYLGALWYATQRRPLGLVACAGMLPAIHPVGGAYAAAALLIGLRFLPVKRLALIGALSTLAWIPFYYRMIFMQRGQFWLDRVTFNWAVTQTIQAVFVNTLTPGWSLIAALLIGVLLLLGALTVYHERNALTYAALLLPAALMLIISIWKPVYFYRPAQPLVIPLAMLAGLLAAPKRWYTWILLSACAVVLMVGTVNYDPSIRGGHLDQAAATIRAEWQPGDKIVYISATSAYPFAYYLPDLDHCIFSGSEDPSLTPYNPKHLECDLPPGDYQARWWLVWPKSPLFGEQTTTRLDAITAGLTPIAKTNAWQFAHIEVYLVNKGDKP